MRLKLIDEAKKEFPEHRRCTVLGVSESGYFAWKSRPTSRRQNEYLVLPAHIRSQFATSNENYGAPRMHVELKKDSLDVGRHRVARLMRDNGLKALQKRCYKKTRQPTPWSGLHQSIRLGLNLRRPRSEMGAGISYIWTSEGWPDLTFVLDLYSRRIVGWATSDRLKKDLALNALWRTISLRNPLPGFIQHTDRGSQYCSHEYQRILKTHGDTRNAEVKLLSTAGRTRHAVARITVYDRSHIGQWVGDPCDKGLIRPQGGYLV